jgi:predicted pyridoxine 5'-phosphate oxidase superfamily flavin-nucleotide-binding protein
MADKYLALTLTGSVRKAQEQYNGKAQRIADAAGRDALTDEETHFIQSRDSFYMATINESGWPYIQHRGGLPGFLRVVSPTQLAFADYTGNRQLLSTGNLAANDRVALFPDGLPASRALEDPWARPRMRGNIPISSPNSPSRKCGGMWSGYF